MVAGRHETLSTSTLVQNCFVVMMRTEMKSTVFIFCLVLLLVYAHTNPENGMYFAHWTIQCSRKKIPQFGPFKVSFTSPGKDSDTINPVIFIVPYHQIGQ